MKYGNVDVEYNDKTTELDVGYDVNGDGTPDVRVGLKVKTILKTYVKEEILVVGTLAILGALHYFGFI